MTHLWNKVLKRLHNFRRFSLLVVSKNAGNDNDASQSHAEVGIVLSGVVSGRRLDGVGHEAEEGADPEERSETAEEVFPEFQPFRSHSRRSQFVETVFLY